MATEVKFERVTDQFDPNRCQGSTNKGPCPFKASVETKYCPMHSGGPLAHFERQRAVRNYRLGQYQSRVDEFSDSSEVKSLREELGIARLMLENMLNRYRTPDELYAGTGKVGDMLIKIEKLVASCHKMELSNNSLLDRTTVLKIATSIIDVVSKYVTDSNALDAIGNEIVTAIMEKHTQVPQSPIDFKVLAG